VLAQERRFRICEILAEQRTVAAAELIERLGVTAATIRRDLSALEKEGLLMRSHGGAVSRTPSTSFQAPLDSLMRSNRAEKGVIAARAASLIVEGDTLFLEGSTTVLELARLLVSRVRLTVVTNSPAIVIAMQRSTSANVLCTGGDLQKDLLYLSGVWTQRVLSEIRLDRAILGVSAIDSSYGVSTASHNEAQVKQAAVRAAKVCIGLADHSKFGKQGFAFVGPVTDLDYLVTDSKADPEQVADLRKRGVEVLIASEAKRAEK
jgi:DeoR/GlpR family transcriptional regulator of sugar metabolism